MMCLHVYLLTRPIADVRTDYLLVCTIHQIAEIGTDLLISVMNFDHSVLLLPHRRSPTSIHSTPVAHVQEVPTH